MNLFIAESPISKKIYKLATMLKKIDTNLYIYGEKGSGKTFLANFIGGEIIENPNNLNYIKNRNRRIILIGENRLYDDLAKQFPIQIELKPLKERKEDIPKFIELFFEEIQNNFDINIKLNELNIEYEGENLKELKQKIYKIVLCNNYSKNEVIAILKNYFRNNFNENESYFSMLKIFDKALIETLLQKYKSKLQVANRLKINRNTLSKKVKDFEN